MTPKTFKNLVWAYWKKEGRHTLPWRETTDPYQILVSEVMLQQTQVERVIPLYRAFLLSFPTVEALAKAPLSNVLIRWQGLGYNRRAQRLHEAAKAVVLQHQGVFPDTAEALERLPGIGPYTAHAVAAFAYNKDGIFIETNIRTAVTHHFFPNELLVSDAQIREILEKVYPQGQAREWYAALMDYGAYLKRSGVRLNAKAQGYAKQATFKGSAREVRGAIIRALSKGPLTKTQLNKIFPLGRRKQLEQQLQILEQEKLIVRKGTRFTLGS